MNILQKARELYNKYDADKDKLGFQLIPGGTSGGIDRVKQKLGVGKFKGNKKANPSELFIFSKPSLQRARQAKDKIVKPYISNWQNKIKDTDPELYNITKPLFKAGDITANTLLTGGDNMFVNAPAYLKQPGFLNRLKGTSTFIKGGAQLLSPFTWPYKTALTMASAFKEDSVPARAGAGFLEGQTQIDNIAPFIKEKKIDLPLIGEVDPVKGFGSMLGFSQNPANKQLFQITSTLIPSASTSIIKWLKTTAIRGSAEDIILSVEEFPEDATLAEKAKFIMGKSIQGASSEIVGTFGFEVMPKQVKKFFGKVFDELKSLSKKADVKVELKKINTNVQKSIEAKFGSKKKFEKAKIEAEAPGVSQVEKEAFFKKVQEAKFGEDLATQAKKYKSAEEFIGAQGKPLYHGTPYKFDDFKKGKTTYFTPKKSFAENYGSEKSRATEMDANIQILERFGKVNLFDGTNKADIEKLGKILPDEVTVLGPMVGMSGEVSKKEVLERMQGIFTQKTPEFVFKAKKAGEIFKDMSIAHEGTYRIKKINKNSVVAEKIRRLGNIHGKNTDVYKTVTFKKNKTYQFKDTPYWRDFEGDTAIEEAIKKLGYDGWISSERDVPTYAIFNPEKLKTKSQLTDIYNKAKTPDLATEAKKYKSVEEFVEAQGTPVYHGTDLDTKIDSFRQTDTRGVGRFTPNQAKGLYFTENKNIGNFYADVATQSKDLASRSSSVRSGGNVIDAYISQTAKIKELPKMGSATKEAVDALEIAKREGFDGIRFMDKELDLVEGNKNVFNAFKEVGDTPKTIIINNPEVIKTKSQLTDIYNKAKTPDLSKQMPEAKFGTEKAEGVGVSQVEKEAFYSKTYEPKTDLPESKTTENLKHFFRSADEQELGTSWERTIGRLENVQAGKRILNANGEFVTSTKSTFPDWLPNDLKDSKLINKVLENIQDPDNIKYPPKRNTRETRLMDTILNEINDGVDTYKRIEPFKNQDNYFKSLEDIEPSRFGEMSPKTGEMSPKTGDKTVKSTGLSKIESAIVKNSKNPKIKSTLEQGTGVSQKITDTRYRLVDKFAPVEVITRKLRQDGKLVAENDPFKLARLYAGRGDKIDLEISKLEPILKPINKEVGVDNFTNYLVADRVIELDNRGVTKFPGGMTLNDAKLAKQQLSEKLGPEKMQFMENSVKEYRTLMDSYLQKLCDSGVISKKSLQDIRSRNESYTPFLVAEYLQDNLDKIPSGKNTLSVASQNVISELKGSTKEIVDPLESSVRQISKIVSLTERNNVAKKLANLANMKETKGIVAPLKKGEVPAKGFDKVSYFENGVKKDIVVPTEVANSMKGLDAKRADTITKIMAAQNTLLRMGATTYNVGFLIPNVIRDTISASVISKHGLGKGPIDSISNWVGSMFSTIKQDDIYKQWLKSGGGGGTVSGTAGKGARKTVQDVSGEKSFKTVIKKVISSPIKLLEEIGRISEETTRVGIFKQAIKKGETPLESAFLSREGTVDFSKSGNVTKIVNQWVPFLNARLQGTVNLVNSFKARPAKTAARITAIVGVPTVATYLWNSQFEDFEDIPQFEKDANFIIITRDRTAEEKDNGDAIHGIKLPKGDVGSIFANPTEGFLDYVSGRDPKRLDQMFLDILGDMSPIGSRPREIASAVTPSWLKAFWETLTNKNLYTGRDIEPQYIGGVAREDLPTELRSSSRTGPTAKFLSEKFLGKFGLSPAKIENVAGTVAGGTGRQVLQAGDAVFGEFPNDIRDIPVARRFTGIRGGKEIQQGFERAEEISKEEGAVRFQRNKTADEIIKKVSSVQNPREKQAIIEEYSQKGELTEDVIDRVKFLNKKTNKLKGTATKRGKISRESQQIKTIQTNTGKAKFIIQEVKRLKTPRDKEAYLIKITEDGILTKNLKKEIQKINRK